VIPWEFIESSPVPGSREELMLYRRGEEFSICIGRDELMNSRQHGSEEALARIACRRVAASPSPRVLIGGLGMGYTLSAALEHLGPDAEVVVAELSPAVVAWNRGPLAKLAGSPLADPRVRVFEGDVAGVYRDEEAAFAAILLDVDNGPEAMTRKANDWLYGLAGLETAQAALQLGGILGVWSATPDRAFDLRLRRIGFRVEELRVPARIGAQKCHTIWIAERRPAPIESRRRARAPHHRREPRKRS